MMKKNLKQFPLDSKTNCIKYLQHLIISAYKYLEMLKRYKLELESYIENKIMKNNIKKINPDIYIDFNNRINGVNNQLLNIFGDNSKSASSYLKFRRHLDNKKNKNIFNLPRLSEDIKQALNEINNLRNWSLHIPESLLVSEMELSKDYEETSGCQKLYDGIIRIPHFTTYSSEWLLSLLIYTSDRYEIYRKINQQMKKDLSYLIGVGTRMQIVNYDCRDIEDMMIAKRSLEIQSKKR